MLFKLASRQGARPVLLSPTKRTGVPRPLCRSYVLDKWRQLRNTLFALARPPTPTPCSSSKRTREDENDIGRYHNSEHEIGETQAIGPPGGKENSETRTCEVRGKLVEAPAGIGGIRVVGQRSSARCHYRGSQGSSRLPPCITRGGSTQQRRPYSKDGFGGGQHFPHSDHEQDSLGLFGNGHRRAIKPERIIIVRHGESLGNFDESTYVHVPDWKIPLTKKGFGEGKRAGQKIKEVIGDKPLFIYTSPYLRTKQTLAGMVEAFDTNYIVGVREEPRLTEQQFGNFQNLTSIVESKAERARFGRFYYRFPLGESGLDVYNRATSFIATMFRDFANQNIAREDLNVIIVTHGLTLRLLVMRWFQYSIADFEQTINPANGAFVVMERRSKKKTESRFFESTGERRDLGHWYELTPESRAHINFGEQRQFGSLWKLLSELPDEPGVVPQEFRRHAVKEDAGSNPDDKKLR